MIAATAQTSTYNCPQESACGKATAGTGAVNVDTKASDTNTNGQSEDLFDIAQTLTSLGRKVSGTDAIAGETSPPTTNTSASGAAQETVGASASNSFAASSSSSKIFETVDGRLNDIVKCSAMSASSSSSPSTSNVAEGSKSTENDPTDDQTYGRFPDILRLMMDYATAEGYKKPPYQRAASWSDDGKSIVILDKTLFCEQILPLFFKRTKFPSFVRKLFRWGFSRVTSKAIRRSKNQIFTHHKFVRLVPTSNASSVASSGTTIAAGATTMLSAFIQQSGAVVPTSASSRQVNAVSPRMTPPASESSQVPPGAMALLSNGVQTNPQDEVVAKLLARRQQLEVEWEILHEEAKLKGVFAGNAPQLSSAAPTGAAFLSSPGANPPCFPHALGVGGSTMLTSSSMQPSLAEQAYYMAISGNGVAFRRVSLEPAPTPAPTTSIPHALPGQAFFTPQEVRAAIVARAAAAAMPRRPQTATAAMVAGGHLPAPTLPGRPESERSIFNAAVHALHNSN